MSSSSPSCLQMAHLPPLQQLELLESLLPVTPLHNSPAPGSRQANEAGINHTPQQQQSPSRQPHKGGGGSGVRGADCQQGPAADIAAFGRLVVQLYRGRMLHHSASDHQ